VEEAQLWEVDDMEDDPSPSERRRGGGAVSVRHWKYVSFTDPTALSIQGGGGGTSPVDETTISSADPASTSRCHGLPSRPDSDWSRNGRQIGYVPPSDRAANPNDAPWKIDLIDLLPAEEANLCTGERPKAADAYHFLRCLLSPLKVHSPWVATTTTTTRGVPAAAAEGCDDDDDGADRADVVMLLLPAHSPFASVLQEFRLADACPAWYLHVVATLSSPAGINNNKQSSISRCLVYRRMPPRVALSSVHWETLEPVPVPGCLWEWHYLPKPADEEKEKNMKGVVADENDDVDYEEQEEPKHVVRLVGPPFFDALAEYPELQIVLDHLGVIREEAQSISQWTAWPEEQHYSAGADENDDDRGDGAESVPWTVFPLCYCFPANDESKRAWVPVMSRAVPRTAAILQRPELRRLRTALFSRLAPGARLFAHTGWADLANHVLRVHVPVLLPPASTVEDRPEMGLCGLWVDGVVQTLAPNELVCFDDSKMHWAFNYDAQERVVLILDFERPPGLPPGTATGGHTEELDRFILQAQGLPY
jgi:Aspartyl/Asparaginyl beta-hydroxylase